MKKSPDERHAETCGSLTEMITDVSIRRELNVYEHIIKTMPRDDVVPSLYI